MATFEELEMDLPNGFHDGLIRAIDVDFVARTAQLRILIDVSPEGHIGRNLYRPSLINIRGLLLFYLEPPPPGLQVRSGWQTTLRFW